MEEGMIFDFKVKKNSLKFQKKFFLAEWISSIFTKIWNQRKSLYPRPVKKKNSKKNFKKKKFREGNISLQAEQILPLLESQKKKNQGQKNSSENSPKIEISEIRLEEGAPAEEVGLLPTPPRLILRASGGQEISLKLGDRVTVKIGVLESRAHW